MKILLSAYACEPNRGSEPGVGWEWATRLSGRHVVTVLTRANNRKVIEASLAGWPGDTRPEFLYVDLPHFLLGLKRKGILPVPLYYLLWQVKARQVAVRRLKEFDLIHHVTFNGFRFPGAWWHTGIPVVLGPLGGGSIADPAYRRCFGKRWLPEWLRGLSVRFWRGNPWTLASLLSADAVLAVGQEMANRFANLGINADLILETAVPLGLEAGTELNAGVTRRDFLLVGNLEPWKAWQIAFEAFAQAISKGAAGQKLIVVGTGSQLADAQKMVSELEISGHVVFAGLQPREEVWKMVRAARGLVFPSIRDTSGNAALEAMALRCPVICFRHQGVAWMTSDECAFRVEPGDWKSSVADFARAIKVLADDDELVTRMGDYGRARAMEEFTWDAKIQKIEKIYGRVRKINKDL
jgi:glycosyltransferase involved in cell wall biosynthesis